MARTLKMQRRQAAKAAKNQLIRWKREQRRETRREEEDAKRKVRSQAHEIGFTLESFLFWLSFILFQVIRIMSAAALEALRKELPRGTTAGQSRRRYRDPAVAVDDADTVLSQGDTPSSVKKQVPSVRDIAIQVDQPQHVPVRVSLGQPSRTPSVKTTATQADLPQRLSRTDNP